MSPDSQEVEKNPQGVSVGRHWYYCWVNQRLWHIFPIVPCVYPVIPLLAEPVISKTNTFSKKNESCDFLSPATLISYKHSTIILSAIIVLSYFIFQTSLKNCYLLTGEMVT